MGAAKKKTTTTRKSVAKSATTKATKESASVQIERMIEKLQDFRGKRLSEIRQLIHEVDPEVVEEWKWKGTPVWSNKGMYVLANPHKGKVKVTFFHGAKLRDPKKLFNAGLGGNKWRAIDLHEGDKLDKVALKALLREAVNYNTKGKVPKSKGSTAPTGKPVAGTPKLLSGGNPQIPKGDGDAPVQAYIAAMPGFKQDVGRHLDALVERIVPRVRKAVRWNSPFYGVEGQGWFLSYHCFTRYVKVVFLRGTQLNPLPPVESKDPNTRYFHIHEGEKIDDKLLTSWIRQASKLPGDPLF